jgi:hypothetical protein
MWFVGPTCFVTGIMLFMARPDMVKNFVPLLWTISNPTGTPVYPTTLLEAWDMGYKAGFLEDMELEHLVSTNIKINGKMTKITPEQLFQVRSILVEMESGTSIIQRVRGCFSFINFIWLLSIVGITITISPVLMMFAKPIHQFIRYFALEIILPFLRAIKPVYEAMVWSLSYSLVIHASRHMDTDSKVFICLTGLFGAMIAMAYTTYLHKPKLPSNIYCMMVSMFFAIISLPLAIHFDSILIAFYGVFAMYSALGFGVSVSGLCYYVGFESHEALERCLLSSFFLLIGLLWGHITRPDLLQNIRVLIPALNVFGSVIYFIALLIKTNIVYDAYWPTQLWMIFSLVSVGSLGSIYQIESLRNVSMIFTVLYMMEKICNLVLRMTDSVALVVFFISVVLWKASLYLHQNPVLLVCIFE